jgi:hypothetical protein
MLSGGTHGIQQPLAKGGSSLFSAGIFCLSPDGPGSDPQMAQISTDVFMISTRLLNLRNLRMVV